MRAHWAYEAWRNNRGWFRWIVEITAVPVLKVLLSLVHILVTSSFDDPFSGLEFWIQEFGLWNALHVFLAVLIVLSLEWFLAPGRMDQKRQNEIESLKASLRTFEDRLKPNVWATGQVYGDAPISDRLTRGEGMNVGFKIDNKSDSDLQDVQVGLTKLEMSFANCPDDDREFLTNKDIGRLAAFPIMLEWNPEQQGCENVLSTTIPAGTSRLVGLFSTQAILTVRHEVRPRLTISSAFVYRVAIQLSARGLPAVTSQDFLVSRTNRSQGLVRSSEVPYEIHPGSPSRLIGQSEDDGSLDTGNDFSEP